MSILSRIFGGKKAASQSKGVKRLANRGLKLELLEDRQLLSASDISPTGWNLMVEGDDNGISNTSEASPEASLNFGYTDGGEAVFGFVVAAQKTEGNGFKPGAISIVNNTTDGVIAPFATQYSQDKSIVLVKLSPSEDGYTINVSSNGSNYGQFVCEVYLPGDRNGDGIVSSDEIRETKGTLVATSPDPWVSVFQSQFGHSIEWFRENVSRFDHNLDGIISTDDVSIATQNGNVSQAAGNMADKVNLNADQKSPEIVVPDNEDDAPLYEPTYDDDGNLVNVDVHSTKPTAEPTSIITFTDDNPIATVTFDGKELTVPEDRCVKNEETGLFELKIDSQDFEEGGIFEEAIKDGDKPENFTFDKVSATDSYGNSDPGFGLHYENEAEEEVATPVVVGTKTVNGDEKPTADTLVLYEGNLQDYVSSASDAFILISDGAQGRFQVVDDEVVDIVAADYQVVYSLDNTGKITLKLEDLKENRTEPLDPYAWLSTAIANSGDNQKTFGLSFKVANIYKANSTVDADWVSGTLTVNLDPVNDAPKANNSTSTTVTQGTPGIIDVLAGVSDKDRWDDLSIISVAGKDGTPNAFASGTISGGTYDGMKYADIVVSTTEGDKTIRVINATNLKDETGDHKKGSKLVVDLLGNFDFLRANAELPFLFTYTANDKYGVDEGSAGTSAVVSIIAKGINDQPVATNVTTTTETNENTSTTYTLTTEVTDADTYPTDTETYKVNVATTPTWTSNYLNTDDRYTKIAAKMNALDLLDYVSTADEQGNHEITFNPITGTGTDAISAFNFLGVDEWVTITYEYNVTDNSGESNATSENATITFNVTGVNNKPTVTGWTHTQNENIGSTITIAIAEYTSDPDNLDVDVNDTHTFYQVLLKDDTDPTGYSLQSITDEYQRVYDKTSGEYVGQIRFHANGDGTFDQTKLDFDMNYQAGYDTSDTLKWKYSDNTGNDIANLPITLTVKDNSEAENAVSEQFTVTVQAVGVYDSPEIKPGQSIIISVSTEASASGDWNKAFTAVEGKVDAGYVAAWSIADTFKVVGGDQNVTNSYFTIGTDGKLAFIDEAARDAFVSAYMPEGTVECDIVFAVTLGDNSPTAGTDTENVTFKVMVKMPPVVTSEETVVDTGIVVYENGTPDGSTDIVETVTYAGFADDYDVAFAEDEETVAKPIYGDRSAKYWYDFSSVSWNREDSYIKYLDGSITKEVHFDDTLLSGYLDETAFAQHYEVSNDGEAYPDRQWTFNLDIIDDATDEKVFYFLSLGDTATLVFDVTVVDLDFGCSTTVQFMVNVKGVNDVPVIKAADPTNVFEKTDVATGGTYKIWGNTDIDPDEDLVSDPDWRDSVAYNGLSFTGGTVFDADNNVVDNNAGTYFGMSSDDFLALLNQSTSQSEFLYTTDENLQKLPLDNLTAGQYAILNYTFQAKDNNEGTSAGTKTVTIKVVGTNQNPEGIEDKSAALDLREVTEETENLEINLFGGITDIDTDDIDSLVAEYVIEGTGSTLAISVTGSDTDYTDTFAAGFRGALSYADGVITLNTAGLKTAFESLQKDTVATVTFNYKVKDQWGAYCDEEKTVTITITGKNEAPTQSNIVGMTVDASSAAGVEIPWFANSSDPDTILNDDTRILAEVNGTAITSSIDSTTGVVTYETKTLDITGTDGESLGYVTVGTTGVLTYFPSGDYLKWQLNQGDTRVAPVTYLVKDQHGASTAPAANANVTVNGVFDEAEFTEAPDQTVTTATPDVDGWVKLSEPIEFTFDIGEDYTFVITSVVVSEGSTGTFANDSFKIEYNEDRSETTGEATASVYVKKAALDTCDDVTKLPVITVDFSYTNGDTTDTGTDTFAVTVTEKNSADIDDASGSFAQHATAAVNWQLNGTAPDGTTLLAVTDPDNGDEAAIVLGIDNFTFTSATFTGFTGDLTEDNKAALLACLTSATAGEGDDAVFTLTFTPNEEVYKFIPAGASLEVVFGYNVTSYKTGETVYNVTSPGVITMTINGINDIPSTQYVAYSGVTIKESDGIANIPLETLYGGDSTYKALYDIDGNPSTSEDVRVSDLATNPISIWDPTLNEGSGGWVDLVADNTSSVANVYFSTNVTAPTVKLVTIDGKLNLQIATNGYYTYQATDTTLSFKFRAIDQQGAYSDTLQTAAKTMSFTVEGEYVAPTHDGTIIGIRNGDVKGYQTSDGLLTIGLNDIGFSYTANTCSFDLILPNGADTDFLVKTDDALTAGPNRSAWTNPESLDEAAGYSYWFDDRDASDVKLVFQFISQEYFTTPLKNIGSTSDLYSDILGVTLDMSPLEGLKINLDDGHGNTAENATEFSVKCNQQETFEISLVATTNQNLVEGVPTLAGTTSRVNVKGKNTYTNYITQDDLDVRTSKTDPVEIKVFGEGENAKRGYYVEIWLQDNLKEYYNTDVNGINSFQFLVTYDADKVINGYVDPSNDPGKSASYDSSIGWGVYGDDLGNGTLQEFRPDIRYNDVRENAFFISVVWNPANPSAGKLTPNAFGENETNNTRYGMDGTTAVLVCTLFVEVPDTVTTADEVNMGIKKVDKQYSAYDEWGDPQGLISVGNNTRRSFTKHEGYSDAATNYELVDSQIVGNYKKYTTVSGTTKSELVSDNGIYVRTVATPSEETVVKELSGNLNYLNEWESHFAELWVKASDSQAVSEAGVTLTYNPEYFAPNSVEFDGILGEGNYTIDYEAGTITIVAEASKQTVVDGYVLLARVGFTAMDVEYAAADDSSCSTEIVGIPWAESNIAHDLGWALGDGYVNLFNTGRVESYLGLQSTTEVWAVPYDFDDDGVIHSPDYVIFSSMYGKGLASPYYSVFFDFDRDGVIAASDYVYLMAYYGKGKSTVAAGGIVTFPVTFTQRYAGSTLQMGEASGQVGQILDAANNTWKDALGLDDTMDVQIYVTNLTDGDLAKAVVTKYDENGLPTAGAIYLDDDGMGQTWYAQTKADNAGSTKYDLYTVLLHELGHLYGYNANDEFSSVAAAFNFVDAEEGHSTVESDLMYPDVDPGTRKEISVNDAFVLATLYKTYSSDYSIPEALAAAWENMNTANAVVVENAPATVAAVIQEEVFENDPILVTMGAAVGVQPKEGVERATLEKLNALGVNIPGVAIIENAATLNDGALDGLFPPEDDGDDDDDDEFSLVPEGNDEFESVIDSVLEEYGE